MIRWVLNRCVGRQDAETRYGLGARLAVFRDYLGLTQTQAAQKFGSARRSWNRYENENHLPKESILRLLRQEGLNIEWLRSGKGTMLEVGADTPAPEAGAVGKGMPPGFTDRLKQVRQHLHQTQSGMSSLLGLGKKMWQRYESGMTVPGGLVLKALIPHGININWLLLGAAGGTMFELPAAATIPNTLPGRLRWARQQLGLTQAKFATTTGVGLPTLKAYEGGKCSPGSKALSAISRTGINIHWLVTGNGTPFIEEQESV